MRRRLPWWKRCLAGTLGGLAGTAAMHLYWSVSKKAKANGDERQPKASKEHDISIAGRKYAEDESAPAAVGRIVYEKITGNEPDPSTKGTLSNIVHWGYGADMGAIYGLVRGEVGAVDVLGGIAYGTGLWALGDELAVPLLGLAKGPKGHPLTVHAEGLGAHLAYGVTTAATTQLLERVL